MRLRRRASQLAVGEKVLESLHLESMGCQSFAFYGDFFLLASSKCQRLLKEACDRVKSSHGGWLLPKNEYVRSARGERETDGRLLLSPTDRRCERRLQQQLTFFSNRRLFAHPSHRSHSLARAFSLLPPSEGRIAVFVSSSTPRRRGPRSAPDTRKASLETSFAPPFKKELNTMAACFSCFGSKKRLDDEEGDFPDDDGASFHSAGGASNASFATMASYRTAVSVVDVASPSSRGAAAPAAVAVAAASAAAAFTRRSTAALLRAFEAAAAAQQCTAGSHAPGIPVPQQEVERAVEKLIDVLEEREEREGNLVEELEDVDIGDAGSVVAAEPEHPAAAASAEPSRRGFWARRFSKKNKGDEKEAAAAVEEVGGADDDAVSLAPSISVSQHLAAEQEEGERELELVAGEAAAKHEDDGTSSCASTPQVAAPADAAVTVIATCAVGSELTNKGSNVTADASSQSPSKAAAARTMSVRERAAAIERAA